MFDTLQFVVDSRQLQLTSQLAAAAGQRQTEVYRTSDSAVTRVEDQLLILPKLELGAREERDSGTVLTVYDVRACNRAAETVKTVQRP